MAKWALWTLAALSAGCIAENSALLEEGSDAGGPEADVDATRRARLPVVSLTPTAFVFPHVAVGETVDRTVLLENTGAGDLLIDRVQLAGGAAFSVFWGPGATGDEFVGITADGAERFSYPIRVEPGARTRFIVSFSPHDSTPAAGQLTLETNAAEGRVVVPITSRGDGPEIQVSPAALSFGHVTGGEEQLAQLEIANVGRGPLNIDRVLLNGSRYFFVLFEGQNALIDPGVLADPDRDSSPGLAAGARFGLTVLLRPPDDAPAAGELIIVSDDPARPEVRVPLSSNEGSPCIRVQPPVVEFARSLVGRTDSRPLTLESCGGEALVVESIAVRDDDDGVFGVDLRGGTLPLRLPPAEFHEPLPAHELGVRFQPIEAGSVTATLAIGSNDPANPMTEVTVLARAVEDICARAQVVEDSFSVAPGQVVDLDGSPSMDPDGPNGRPSGYAWAVTERPEGSTSEPVESFFDDARPAGGGRPDDLATPTARFFADLAGRYTIELRVTDAAGCEDTVEVRVEATPVTAIHARLTWTTPDAPGGPAGATDLDLHLLHPAAGNWFDEPFDCYSRNPSPDWGELAVTDDDPRLDVDDSDGSGPENIRLDDPQNTGAFNAAYLVGVHYFNDRDRRTGELLGPSRASVRIYLNGELALERERDLLAAGHFWDVAGITWPVAAVRRRDNYFEERP